MEILFFKCEKKQKYPHYDARSRIFIAGDDGENPVVGFDVILDTPHGGLIDDTAVNGVDLFCKKGKRKISATRSTSYGSSMGKLFCPEGMAVYGLRTKVQRYEYHWMDNTGLNAVLLYCKKFDFK